MRIDDARTAAARASHAEGVKQLDRLFGYDRKSDATGFMLVGYIQNLRVWRRRKKAAGE